MSSATATHHVVSGSPAGASSRRPHRRSGLRFAIVAIVSLGLGATAALLYERSERSAPTPAGAHDMPGEKPPPGAGEKAVYISPARQQLIGVRTTTVEKRTLERSRRVVAALELDETKVTEIHTRVAGWVETVHVDYVGKQVHRGEPLFSVYSPELVSAQGEYLVALKTSRALGSGKGDPALLAAARDRLRRFNLGKQAIDRLEKTGKVNEIVTVSSPFAGVVLERKAYPGQYVTPEMASFKIGDLSTIWVVGQIFEHELSEVRVGQPVEVEFPYGQAARRLRGEIDFIYPEVDPMTRRVKVRAVFDNPDLELKPSTYVTLLLQTDSRRELAIPREAVLDDGKRQYVLLALEDGYFEPREVELGPPADDHVPVQGGLSEGDRVVVSAQFLIDSETNLKAAMRAMMMSMPGMDMGGEEHGEHEGRPGPPPDAPPTAPLEAPAPEHQDHGAQ